MNQIRYGKPNMNNLPYELGRSIFDEILNSPKVNRKEKREKVLELQRKMIEERQRIKYGK